MTVSGETSSDFEEVEEGWGWSLLEIEVTILLMTVSGETSSDFEEVEEGWWWSLLEIEFTILLMTLSGETSSDFEDVEEGWGWSLLEIKVYWGLTVLCGWLCMAVPMLTLKKLECLNWIYVTNTLGIG